MKNKKLIIYVHGWNSHKKARKAVLIADQLKSNVDLPLELAEEVGLDVEQLLLDANDPKIDFQIQKEYDQMRNSGIPRLSVPKFLINGKEPQGKRDFANYSAIIEAELKKK